MKKYDYKNLKGDEHVSKSWTPLKFNIKENYKYVSNNVIYNLFSNIVYFVIVIILTIFDRLLWGYKVVNKNKLLKNTGFVSISNHVHQMDCTFIALTYFPKRVYYPTLASNFQIPVIRHLIKLLYAMPIPSDKKQKEKFYSSLKSVLDKGKIVHMYPEGSLWPYYDKVRDFKYGAFKIAVESNVPIQPIRFSYTKRWYKRKPAIICEVLDPLYPNEKLTKEDRIKDLKDRCLCEMRVEK